MRRIATDAVVFGAATAESALAVVVVACGTAAGGVAALQDQEMAPAAAA